jgi:hypothetical protein
MTVLQTKELNAQIGSTIIGKTFYLYIYPHHDSPHHLEVKRPNKILYGLAGRG